MSLLNINRWENTFLARHRIPEEQIQRWLNGLNQLNIGSELDTLASEEWVLIRRLQLKARLDENHGESQAANGWSNALTQELRKLLENGQDNNIVRYASRRDACCDMLYRTACGDLSRAWAWKQMGLLPPHGDFHSNDSGMIFNQAAQHFLAEPATIWPLLTRLIKAEAETGALTMLIQVLPATDLQEWLTACPQTRPYQQLALRPSPLQGNDRLHPTLLVTLLMRWISDHTWLVRRHRQAVMVLLAAAAQPADETIRPQAGEFAAQRILAASRALMDGFFPPQAELTDHSSSRGATPQTGNNGAKNIADTAKHLIKSQVPGLQPANPLRIPDSPHEDSLADTCTKDEMPIPPSLPDHIDEWVSQWGGLLFLLHLVPDTGLLAQLERLAGEKELHADTRRHILWQLATQHLKIPADDPVVRAFCGGWQPGQQHGNSLHALPGELEQTVHQAAETLRSSLAKHLPLHPELTMEAICRRQAKIRFEQGWIEARMPLKQADSRLRRAALDLDPGWIPWLGCVMRFIYE